MKKFNRSIAVIALIVSITLLAGCGATGNITFSTEYNYHNALSLLMDLPEGVKSEDITSISMFVSGDSDLNLRLYELDETYAIKPEKEITGASFEIKENTLGTDTVEIDGRQVARTKHTLTYEETGTTRVTVSAGKHKEAVFTMDEKAHSIIDKTEDKINLLVYAHNIAPTYTLEGVKINTANGSYDIKINKNDVSARMGGTIK